MYWGRGTSTQVTPRMQGSDLRREGTSQGATKQTLAGPEVGGGEEG